MSRYIDADALQERLRVEFEREGTKAVEMAMLGCGEASVKYNHGQFCYLNAQELVKDAPTADVVEVVRCKDCEYCRISIDPKTNISVQVCGYVGYNPVQSSQVTDNDYCSHGERSENGK